MVSPASCRSTAVRASSDCCSVAATTRSRTALCSARSGSRNARTSPMLRLVVHGCGGSQLLRLRFRPGVAQEVTAADFRTGQILEQVRLAQRRVAFDVEVEA